MSSFLKGLMELGEEEKEGQSPSNAADVAEMSTEQLQGRVQHLERQLSEKTSEYETLRTEGVSLRSEFDAYKRKVDQWQRQMKESREADRKVIDELRKATSGDVADDAYIKTMTDTIAKYKQELRDANDEVGKAYRKQKDAEEARKLFEEAKHREVSDLGQKLDHFKDRMKRNQEKYEQQITDLKTQLKNRGADTAGDVEAMKQKMKALEDEANEVKNQESLLRDELKVQVRKNAELQQQFKTDMELLKSAVGTESIEGGTTGDTVELAGIRMELEAAQRRIAELEKGVDANETLRKDLAKAKSQVESLKSKLQGEQTTVSSLKKRVAALESDATKAQEQHEREMEDAQWASMDLERKLAEVRTQLDASKSAVTAMENRMERAKADHSDDMKALKNTIAEMEERAKEETQRVEALVADHKKQLAAAAAEVQAAKDREAMFSQAAAAVEDKSVREAETLETLRAQYEDELTAAELRYKKLEGQRDALQASYDECRNDLHHRDDIIDDLRQELDSTSGRLQDLEGRHTMDFRTLQSREDDLLLRERERQSLKTQLTTAENQLGELRTKVRSLEQSRDEMTRALKAAEQQVRDMEAEARRSEEDIQYMKKEISDNSHTLRHRDGQLSELTQAAKEYEHRIAELGKQRDEATSKMKYYENRVKEMHSTVASHNAQPAPQTQPVDRSPSSAALQPDSPPATGANPPSNGSISTARAPLRSGASRPDYGRTQRSLPLTWTQRRNLIAAAVVFLLFVGLIQTQGSAGGSKLEMDTIGLLQKRYDQSMASVKFCHDALDATKAEFAKKCPQFLGGGK